MNNNRLYVEEYNEPVKKRELGRDESKSDKFLRQSKASQIISLLPSKQAQSSKIGYSVTRKQEFKKRKTRDMAKVYPEKKGRHQEDDPDLQVLKERGINIRHMDDAREQYKAMQMIRQLPCSMDTKRKFRAKLDRAEVKTLSGYAGFKHAHKLRWKKFKIGWREFMGKIELWGSSLKRVEGQQGTGVVSYFTFLRTLFKLDLVIFLLLFIFVTIPAVTFSSNGYVYTVTGTSVSGVDTTNADTCSAAYTVNVSSDAGTLIVDFLQGTGWMEDTAFYYGWYQAVELSLGESGGHTFNYINPLSYFTVALVILLISLIVMARSTTANFKESIMSKGETNKYTYCQKVFCSWDYALVEDYWAELKQKSIHKDIAAELAEDKFRTQRENMTTGEKCKLYTIRFFINFLILAILGGASYLVYYVQNFATGFTSSDTIETLLVQYLPSVTLGLLNGMVPLFFNILIKLEKYTPAFAMKLHLARIVFLKLASLTILIITLYTAIKCTPKTTTCNVAYDSCTTLTCWETFVGQSFYKLVFMDILINAIVPFAVEWPRKLIGTKCASPILKKVGPAEFDIPKSVLDLVYSQMLCWLGFWFAPMLSSMIVISMVIKFYAKYFSALVSTGPPEKPYRASKNNTFFMAILLVSFFMCSFIVGYVMVSLTPSKGCGPFRIYSDPSTIVPVTISNFPDWMNDIISVISSTSAIIILIVLLCLVIYYCTARGSANKEVVDMLEEQLVMESKDKQFLMAKLYEVTGEKKPTGIHTHQKLTTVNENVKVPPKPQVSNGDIPPKEEIAKQLPSDDIPPPVYYDNPPDDPKTIHVSPDISRENTNTDWDDRRPSSRLPPIISKPIAPTVTPSGVNGIDF